MTTSRFPWSCEANGRNTSWNRVCVRWIPCARIVEAKLQLCQAKEFEHWLPSSAQAITYPCFADDVSSCNFFFWPIAMLMYWKNVYKSFPICSLMPRQEAGRFTHLSTAVLLCRSDHISQSMSASFRPPENIHGTSLLLIFTTLGHWCSIFLL